MRMRDAAEEVVRPIMPRPQVVDRDALLLGYAGVYSSFLLHARRASSRFGVDTKDILIELGRRRIVGGQEDMIIDVAIELAGPRASARPSRTRRPAPRPTSSAGRREMHVVLAARPVATPRPADRSEAPDDDVAGVDHPGPRQ
jgi:hypothetical protein